MVILVYLYINYIFIYGLIVITLVNLSIFPLLSIHCNLKHCELTLRVIILFHIFLAPNTEDIDAFQTIFRHEIEKIQKKLQTFTKVLRQLEVIFRTYY